MIKRLKDSLESVLRKFKLAYMENA